MENTCKNCKFWKEYDIDIDNGECANEVVKGLTVLLTSNKKFGCKFFKSK